MKRQWIIITAPTLIAGEPVNPSDKAINVEEDTGRLLFANHKARKATAEEIAEAEAEAPAEVKAEAETKAPAKKKINK